MLKLSRGRGVEAKEGSCHEAIGAGMGTHGFGGRGLRPNGPMMGPMMGSSHMDVIRPRYVMMYGIPEPYRDASNPLPPTAENIKAGGALYAANCMACHGVGGYGNGPAGADLNPPPANIATFVRTAMATDPYLFWTLSEGGKPLGTAMPAFKDTLSAADRWKIILYLRAGLPAVQR